MELAHEILLHDFLLRNELAKGRYDYGRRLTPWFCFADEACVATPHAWRLTVRMLVQESPRGSVLFVLEPPGGPEERALIAQEGGMEQTPGRWLATQVMCIDRRPSTGQLRAPGLMLPENAPSIDIGAWLAQAPDIYPRPRWRCVTDDGLAPIAAECVAELAASLGGGPAPRRAAYELGGLWHVIPNQHERANEATGWGERDDDGLSRSGEVELFQQIVHDLPRPPAKTYRDAALHDEARVSICQSLERRRRSLVSQGI